MGVGVAARTTPHILALALVSLALGVSGAAAQQVVVEVRDAGTGRSVPDARLEFVDVPGNGGVRLTALEGRVTFDRVPPGVWTLRVTTLTYEEREMRVEVLPDTTTFVRVELTAAPISLDSLLVTTDRLDPLLLDVGFYERSTSNRGYYYDPERIQRIAGGTRLSSKLKYMMRVNITLRSSREPEIWVGRIGQCRPEIYVDGMRLRGVGVHVDNIVHPNDVVGVEIYDMPNLIPIEFRRTGVERCVILIWTRRR